jgi:flagellar protein FlaG
MDINRISGIDQGGTAVAQPAPTRVQTGQPPATAAPVLPNNGIRVTAASQAAPVAINQAELTRSLEEINRFLQPVNGDIIFSQDDDTGRTIVKIIDTKTQTVLRQIPTKEVVEIAKELDKLQGLLLREKV